MNAVLNTAFIALHVFGRPASPDTAPHALFDLITDACGDQYSYMADDWHSGVPADPADDTMIAILEGARRQLDGYLFESNLDALVPTDFDDIPF